MNELELLNCIKDIGLLLLQNGAEIYRVEESVKEMCKGCGFRDIEVFVIPTYFSLSVTLHDGTPYTSTKRSRKTKVHLDHLYDLNDLVRKISSNSIDYEDIPDSIANIKNHTFHQPLIFLGYILSTASFTVFFSGGINEMIAGAVLGAILYVTAYMVELVNVNSIFKTIVMSMISAFFAFNLKKIGLISDYKSLITGAVMLLVPGIAITNSLRDIIGGDFVSGVTRLGEAIIIATSIAVGVGVVLTLLRGA